MFEIFVLPFLPQLSKVLSVLLIFISGYTVINLNGGIPRKDNRIISKIESLFIIVTGWGILLFIIEPIVEGIIISLLYQYVKFALAFLFIIGGIAILVFDKKMKWDYSKYGYGCIVVGIIWSVFIL